MPIGGFADQAVAGAFAVEWTSCRHTLTPTEGPFTGLPLKLSGVWGMSGMGFAREGVNLIWPADGTGVARKITKGRENPNEITLQLDPLTYANIIEKYICPPGKSYKFNYEIQYVDPSGLATKSRRWKGCVTTGDDSENPEDGSAHKDAFKFKPTARG